MNKNLTAFFVVIVTMSFTPSLAQNVGVYAYPKIKRYLGDTSTLDREVYFTLHSTGADDVEAAFYNDYNASASGRGFWGPASFALNITGEVGIYPDSKTWVSGVKEVTRYISTEHPNKIYKEGIDPEIAANWVVEYFNNHVGTYLRPEFFEPMNEPFVHARDFYSEADWNVAAEARVKLEMAQLFKAIGMKMDATPELANIKVIGYASAWPSFEKNDFSVWNENMKMFMDEAGDHMDAFSTHLYDGVNQVGQDTKRSGSNLEAVLDLIETYSFSKWNEVKPHVISEYGGIVGSTYSDESNVQSIRSQNAMLFGLLERQNRIEMSIPFTTGKSTWHISASNNYMPYKAALYKPIPLGVPLDQVTGWEYTDRIYFYDLWRNVSGDRFLIRSNNPDVQVQGFRDGTKLYVALNNLDGVAKTVNLNIDTANIPNFLEVRIKSLVVNNNERAQFSDQTTTTIPSSYSLAPNETVVLEYTYESAFEFGIGLVSKTHYNGTNVQPIFANSPMNYNFTNVLSNDSGGGFASLRMSIGRKHDRSKSPIVHINGNVLTVPTNWKGYNQANRDDFFGMIEINAPITLLQSANTVSITFPDTGGHVSSVVLVRETYDTNILSTEKTMSKTTLDIPLLYPNPSKGVVYFKNVSLGNKIQIFDLTGQELYRANYNGASINLQHLETGVYIVQASNRFMKLVID
ncbi:MAG: T9SS type A sorting domain-containing protein [Flavobacteriaceae bacterium]|nr:T9SS type A sorting domain-containing protein [Flavobacteriaceae bacterium]